MFSAFCFLFGVGFGIWLGLEGDHRRCPTTRRQLIIADDERQWLVECAGGGWEGIEEGLGRAFNHGLLTAGQYDGFDQARRFAGERVI